MEGFVEALPAPNTLTALLGASASPEPKTLREFDEDNGCPEPKMLSEFAEANGCPEPKTLVPAGAVGTLPAPKMDWFGVSFAEFEPKVATAPPKPAKPPLFGRKPLKPLGWAD